LEADSAEGIEPPGFQALDETAGGAVGLEAGQEEFEGGAGSLGFDENALAGIIDPSGEAQAGGETMNEGAEADALDSATEGDFQARC
jgi:hypothetical protein